jgi:uroporphyrinogen-III synthase
MRVIVTRPESEARRWAGDLSRRGFDALVLPLIAIRPATRPQALVMAWARLDDFRAVMFVSGNAVRHFFAQRPREASWPGATRAWATGTGTRQALLEAGVRDAFVDAPSPQAAQFDSETLWQQVAPRVVPADKVLIVRGADDGADGLGRDWLAEQLAAAGVQVETLVAYVRSTPRWDERQLAQAQAAAGGGCVWLFSSSQAIANLQRMLPAKDWKQGRAVATHPRIAEAARRAGFGVVCESRPSLEAVSAALESFR